MENKLGLSYYRMLDVERKLVNFKLNLLDETYTFNVNMFSLEYLVKLHQFLFSDIHPSEYVRLRKLNKIELDYIHSLIKGIERVVHLNDKNEVIELVKEIWNRQIFIVGNTRTMIAYLKVINDAFLLDIPINVNSEIESNPKTFEKICVNQKGLTK